MTWLRRYRLRLYLANSIWVLPCLGIVVALLLVELFDEIEDAGGLHSSLDPDTARAVLGTMASSMFTFVVFVSSALLIAVQLASAQLSPRVIGFVFRDPITRSSLTLFVITFTFTLTSLARITTTVPHITAQAAAYSCLISMVVFLFLIDHVGKALRPSGALWGIARLGRDVIETVYPYRLGASQVPLPPATDVFQTKPTRTIVSPRDGVILAFDIQGLVGLARRADCVIELVPQVGDFIAIGDPLFRLYQGGDALSEKQLCDSVAVGQERTMQQDPALVFRIIVDVASKGLSPAINDPTTAVLAIDQIHHLLRNVGMRRLDDERVRDKTGRLRLAYRTPDWPDFVALAATEIRQFGGSSIQIARRLHAMLENLIETLPEERRDVLRQELKLLQRSTERCFPEPEDRALADISDSQGVGGRYGQSHKKLMTGDSKLD
jgi:uncharacterized membrane protein